MSNPFAPSGSSVPQRGEPARGVDADQVLGEQDLAPLLVEDPPARVDLIGLEQRVADALALGGEEREAHRPADHERVDHTQQRFDDAELVGDLGASEHGHERPLGIVAQAEQHLDFFGEQQPIADGSVRGGPTIEAWARCDAPKASLTYRSMPSTTLRHELGAVALLTGIEPEVLHQLDTGSQLGKPLANGLDRVLRIGLALGTAEVAGTHHRRTALGQPLNRGQRGTDPEVVGDLSVFDRDVEVGAHEHPLAVHIAEVVECRDAVDHQRFFGRLTFEPA